MWQAELKAPEDATATVIVTNDEDRGPGSLREALANAEDKNNRDKAGIDVDNLVVDKITVDQGASMWRIRPRAQGRASWVQKRTSHVIVVLSEH